MFSSNMGLSCLRQGGEENMKKSTTATLLIRMGAEIGCSLTRSLAGWTDGRMEVRGGRANLYWPIDAHMHGAKIQATAAAEAPFVFFGGPAHRRRG